MRAKTFNHSFLAIGVAAVLGLSTTANAADTTTPITTTGVDIINQATASYKVAGQPQPEAKSNVVKVTVSQQVSFSLTADNDDTAQGGELNDDKNQKVAVAPNGFVEFKHTLTNTGNLTDTYDITLGTTDGKYDQGASTISFVVFEEDGITEVRRGEVKYTEGASIPSVLEKGQSVKFTIKSKTSGNKGNETLALQLTATSRYLAGVTGATKTLTNVDTSFTRLPSFGIVKTITNGLDLNDPTDTATYKVVVTNDRTDFGTDATDITIEDFLPDGLKMAKELTADDITISSGATKGTITPGSAGSKGFKITGVNLPVGQNITIVFSVIQDGTVKITPTLAESLINHVTVTDDLDNDPSTENTLIDSTKDGLPENVSTFYPTDDVNNLNGEKPEKPGDDSTVPLLTIERKLTLTGATVREIAPTTGLTSTNTAGQVTHQTIITNTGKDVEGSEPGELTFTINDNDGTNNPDAINIVPGTVTVTYYPNGNDTTTPTITNKTITAVNGVYDLSTALPSGIAPNGTVTIKYNVSANEAPLFTPVNSTTPTFEDTIVTLIPGKEGAPKPLKVTDKTTVRGLVLVKKQAIAEDCAAASTGIVGNFVTTDIGGKNDPTNTTVLPGQCIVYQIEAKNTSSDTAGSTGLGFDITDVIISDEFSKFSANANYVTGSVTAVNGTAAETSNEVTTTVATLTPQETASMQFKVQINTKTGN
ncbi:hypothetical protein IQ457_12400 [Psychrobacter sp. M9-54-1]|uniref:hypothetical protein n=1 Tax=Psychrobacter sp. M9-54-1 TaxID=2782386 RepID=UPI00190A497E|nr:hypothetical protein [Psychrobacter sp. M9-54-1]MBK3394724.1 hypothetical protein [Psychrobacter sp. M9-54-1]